MTTVDFYYHVNSRYSYLASTQIARLEADTGATVRWLPLDSAALQARRGFDPYTSGRAESGQYDWAYRRKDAEDWAAFYDVPFREPVGRLKSNPEELARAALAGERLGAARAVSERIFQMSFVENRTTISRDDLIAAAADLGLGRSRFQSAFYDPATVAFGNERIGEALRRGVFGVPTFLVKDNLFWGQDRMPLLRRCLGILGSTG